MVLTAVEAVLAQTYSPIEVIVVDDGSTDGTQQTVQERFGDACKYVFIGHTGLPAAARNAGLEKASGLFIAFCDSDDVWLPTKLGAQMSALLDTDYNCSSADAYIGESSHTYLQEYRFAYADYRRNLLWDNFFITSSVVIRRDVVGNRRFTTKPHFRGYEDYCLWLSLISELNIIHLTSPLLHYTTHPGNVSKAVRHHDAVVQLRIVLRTSAYLRYPLLGLKKLIRYLFHTLQ
jgi:glycosyltransferase involved in cell wall biosynthesis